MYLYIESDVIWQIWSKIDLESKLLPMIYAEFLDRFRTLGTILSKKVWEVCNTNEIWEI